MKLQVWLVKRIPCIQSDSDHNIQFGGIQIIIVLTAVSGRCLTHFLLLRLRVYCAAGWKLRYSVSAISSTFCCSDWEFTAQRGESWDTVSLPSRPLSVAQIESLLRSGVKAEIQCLCHLVHFLLLRLRVYCAAGWKLRYSVSAISSTFCCSDWEFTAQRGESWDTVSLPSRPLSVVQIESLLRSGVKAEIQCLCHLVHFLLFRLRVYCAAGWKLRYSVSAISSTFCCSDWEFTAQRGESWDTVSLPSRPLSVAQIESLLRSGVKAEILCLCHLVHFLLFRLRVYCAAGWKLRYSVSAISSTFCCSDWEFTAQRGESWDTVSLPSRPLSVAQIESLLRSGVKAEIQCLSAVSSTFLCDVYLPNKIRFGGWIWRSSRHGRLHVYPCCN